MEKKGWFVRFKVIMGIKYSHILAFRSIPYQFQQIGVLLAQNGFIAVLKKVPATPVSFIIIPSMAG
jgi:hypothetical protein